jgi:hypothetical protein
VAPQHAGDPTSRTGSAVASLQVAPATNDPSKPEFDPRKIPRPPTEAALVRLSRSGWAGRSRQTPGQPVPAGRPWVLSVIYSSRSVGIVAPGRRLCRTVRLVADRRRRHPPATLEHEPGTLCPLAMRQSLGTTTRRHLLGSPSRRSPPPPNDAGGSGRPELLPHSPGAGPDRQGDRH